MTIAIGRRWLKCPAVAHALIGRNNKNMEKFETG